MKAGSGQPWAGAYVEELPKGAGVSRIALEVELDEVLAPYDYWGRRHGGNYARASYIAAAYNADGQQRVFARWFAPDLPEVYADDPDALALLATIGAEVEAVMAPDVP